MKLKTMTRIEIITQLRAVFTVSELVCPHTFARFGEKSWQFFDTATLQTLLVLRREILRVPLIINNGESTQRGLRCNLCSIVRSKGNKQYLSAHLMGKGFDVVSSEITAQEMRDKIFENADKLPVPIRIEDGVSWLHFDTFDPSNGKNKVTFF